MNKEANDEEEKKNLLQNARTTRDSQRKKKFVRNQWRNVKFSAKNEEGEEKDLNFCNKLPPWK